MKLLLHIGSTKTGSSAIQKYCFKNRGVLLEHGIYYPNHGVKAAAHHLLAAALHPTARGLHKSDFNALDVTKEEYFDQTAQKIMQTAKSHGAHTVLLSSEYLWGAFGPEFYSHWNSAFSECEIKLTALLRRPDNWIQSSYMQAVKSGNKQEFENWYPTFRNRPTSGSNYFDVIHAWNNGFCRSGVILEDYNELLKSSNFIPAFLELITGVSSQNFPMFEQRTNPSPTADMLNLLLLVNQSNMSPEDKAKVRKVIMQVDKNREIGAELSIVPDRIRLQILEEYVPQCQKIKNRYMEADRATLFKEPWPVI